MKRIFKITILIIAVILLGYFTAGKIRTNYDHIFLPFEFPQDHSLHLVDSEWLYFTGVVETDKGKKIGYEMTIFQMGNVRQMLLDYAYVGHVAVSDPEKEKHYLGETISPIYSVHVEPGIPEVNMKDFYYKFTETDGFTINAESNGIKLNLNLKPTRPILLHDEDGIILMGDDLESAYYSFTNLDTKGIIAYDGKEHNIAKGRTWMDHQWGNFTIPGMHWDWFSMRFNDGAALMIFNLRNEKDQPHRIKWTYRGPNEDIQYGSEAEFTTVRKWRDNPGKATYPIDWTIKIEKLKANLIVKALFDAQSIHHVETPSYWEGLCEVKGTIDGKDVEGDDYTEMTFYNDKTD